METGSARSLQPGLLVQIVPTSGVRSRSGHSVRKLSGSVNLIIAAYYYELDNNDNDTNNPTIPDDDLFIGTDLMKVHFTFLYLLYLGPQNERLFEFFVNLELATTRRYLEPS